MKTCQIIILLFVLVVFWAPKISAVKECYLCENPCKNQDDMKEQKCDDANSDCAVYGEKGKDEVFAVCLGDDYKDFCESITDNYESKDTACYQCSDKDKCNSYMPVDEIFKKQKKKD
ncbi:uncharacterized protein LOC135124896 [Zophobas morio]|uniref:uncharacterized protein LOC135124896 n=1 Tax=Zophobas morio TaxID=2755281 RepID=UPI00308286CD